MTSPPRRRRYDERGVALSSPVALLSLASVVLAGLAFLTTGGIPEPPEATVAVTATPTPEPSATARKPVLAAKKKAKAEKRPVVRRGEVYVEVYNNSGTPGLAGETANRIAGAGWQVVGSDNWYGTIPESTVYYPERLHAAARLLAKDLGISRLRPAVSPMRFDRLTVILTSSYS